MIDTLIVLVQLAGVGTSFTLATGPLDDPAFQVQAIYDLAGRRDAPDAPWAQRITLERWLQVPLVWNPGTMRLTILDPLGILPATRAAREAALAQGRAAAVVNAVRYRSGPGAAFTVEEGGAFQVDGGWSLGRASAGFSASNVRPASFFAAAQPWFPVYVSADVVPATGRWRATARLAPGSVLLGMMASDVGVSANAALLVGPLTLFATTDRVAIATLRLRRASVQAAYNDGHGSVRLQVGNQLQPSAYAPPRVRR